VQRNRPPSAQAVKVLRALAADPARWRYGYDLTAEVHLKSGSLYPILVRLAGRGLLETSWDPASSRTMSCWCSTTTTSSTRATCRTVWASCWTTCPRRYTW
jgi:hypothetical protein